MRFGRNPKGARFKIAGGDRDQTFFSHRMIARRVDEPWFSGFLNRGPAYLLKIEDGPFKGQYLAITSRWVASLEEQISSNAWVSAVVHRILEPGSGYAETEQNTPAIGMAALKVL